MSVANTWGTTASERAVEFPCDRHLEQPDAAYFRGVTINAPPETIFRWLCQMRVAPYSYDWIDNFGRKSPQALTPGLDELAVGEKMMGFDLVEFERDRHLTLWVKSFACSSFAVTYLVVPQDNGRCRLLVKIVAQYPRGPLGWLVRVLAPWADFVMMRKQLLNLKTLAERTARSEPPLVDA